MPIQTFFYHVSETAPYVLWEAYTETIRHGAFMWNYVFENDL